jgi:hypothetical protein
MEKWFSYFQDSPHINFVHSSGGEGRGDSDEYKPGELKWNAITRITKKKMIADCGEMNRIEIK